MNDIKHKMVDGELVELTPEEIAQIERDAAEFAAPPPEPEPQEPDHAKRRSHKR